VRPVEAAHERKPGEREKDRHHEACDRERAVRREADRADPTKRRQARSREKVPLVLGAGVGLGARAERDAQGIGLERRTAERDASARDDRRDGSRSRMPDHRLRKRALHPADADRWSFAPAHERAVAQLTDGDDPCDARAPSHGLALTAPDWLRQHAMLAIDRPRLDGAKDVAT
jgi:hypothetical protein